ncbi:MAG: hypothetical protein EOO87_16725 [Pedobacter sp.]|nr:MAG: hypothetical protein EOO87_16725 [Pedobacter sp.]
MNKFIRTTEKDIFYPNVLFETDRILASDEDYGNEIDFREKVLNGKEGLLDTHLNVLYTDINKVILFEEENIIQIFFKDDKAGFVLNSPADLQEVLQYILSQKKFTKSIEQVNNKGVIVKPALYTLVAGIFSAVLINMANTLANGENVAISGSRKGFKRLLVSIAETLGVWGSLALGIIVTGGFLVYTINKYRGSKTAKTEIPVYS